MLYKFKSKSGGDVVMLGASGDELLRLLGREPASRGIIASADMPKAIADLEAAVKAEETRRAEAVGRGEPPPASPVSLRQRLWPMVELLRHSQADGHDVVWGA